jgi:hypothetical protein
MIINGHTDDMNTTTKAQILVYLIILGLLKATTQILK